ncbi:tRNA (adenosine(37)-N6)-dimethylallyltransferase MiaA [Bacteroidota bacterium]
MSERKLIVIQGPTASGKTNLALYLSDFFAIEILSADSRQFYREMNIGTAKPESKELLKATHHFVGFVSIHEPVDVALYERLALAKLNDVYNQDHIPVLVGGSGLFVDAVLNGINDIPEIKPEVRISIQSELEQNGLDYLVAQLQKLDPISYQKIDLKNSRRVLRALEVCLSSGKPYSSYLNKKISKRPFSALRIALDMQMDDLYDRINHRCDKMLQSGLLDEVVSLLPYKQLRVLNTIGYSELFDYLDEKCTLDQAVSAFKQHSRNYAKRQMTWLRKDKNIHWFKADEYELVRQFISKEL